MTAPKAGARSIYASAKLRLYFHLAKYFNKKLIVSVHNYIFLHKIKRKNVLFFGNTTNKQHVFID